MIFTKKKVFELWSQSVPFKGAFHSRAPYPTYPINFIRSLLLPRNCLNFLKMAQAKIGTPDFYPITQNIEEVAIFFPMSDQ